MDRLSRASGYIGILATLEQITKPSHDWWNDNSFGKNIYIGQSIYRLGSDKNIEWSNGSQIPEPIKIKPRA